MRAFWPIGESAQASYEDLRARTLGGGHLCGVAAARFERRGLAGLITWPATEGLFTADITGARRPAWTPHTDPRIDALAGAYTFLLALDDEIPEIAAVHL